VKIYLKGFFFANLGDDLFVHMIARRYPEHTFTVVVNKEYRTSFISEPNVKVIGLGRPTRLLNRFINIYELIEKQNDISVIISGSIFQEFKNDAYAIKRLQALPGRINPTYLLGANYGPYETEEYYNRSREYLDGLQDVCFRDFWSKELFQDMEHIRCAPDIIFGVEKILTNKSNKRQDCVISVMDFRKKAYLLPYADDYEDFILRAIKYYNSQNYNTILVSFCKKEGDEDAIERILNSTSADLRSKIAIKKYDGTNWEEIVDTIRRAACMVSSRFHSMILGAVFGVPTLPVVYNDKTLHTLTDMGLEQYALTLDQLKKFQDWNVSSWKPDSIDEIKKQSEDHFKILDTVLL